MDLVVEYRKRKFLSEIYVKHKSAWADAKNAIKIKTKTKNYDDYLIDFAS